MARHGGPRPPSRDRRRIPRRRHRRARSRRAAPHPHRRAGGRGPAAGPGDRGAGRPGRRPLQRPPRRTRRTGVADDPGRPPAAARDRRRGPGRLLRAEHGHRHRRPAGGRGTPDHRRRLRAPLARRPDRGGGAGHRAGAVRAPVGRRAHPARVRTRPVRRLRLAGEDAARQQRPAQGPAQVRGRQRDPLLRPAPRRAGVT
ncbi:putative Enoyl-CoA hydratase [Streptomyces misionensis JCM 4497]